jgi:hypothetical protein
VIVASKPDIQTGSVYVERNPDGTYSTTLYTSNSLSIGVHEGTLTLRLYKDAQHTQEYALSGATVPYSITVEPLVSLSVSQGGVGIHARIRRVPGDLGSGGGDHVQPARHVGHRRRYDCDAVIGIADGDDVERDPHRFQRLPRRRCEVAGLRAQLEVDHA